VDYYTLLKSTAVNLSFQSSISSVQSFSTRDNIFITVDRGALKYEFTPSTKEPVFELYNILGSKIENIEIPPGETSVTIPHLPRGLYFVRLGDTVIKAYVEN